MKSKALIVTTTPYMVRQFLMNDIKILQDLNYDVEIATNFKGFNVIDDEKLLEFRKILIDMNIKINQVNFSRNILDVKSMISSYREMGKLLKENRYAILHTHTPIASVISRICARPFRKSGLKVLYTAHGFHFYTGAPKKNWLFYYPIEKWLSRYTDVLITINKEDYSRAKKKFKSKKTKYVPGVGIDVNKIEKSKSIRDNLCKELGISNDSFLLLSVGELSQRKNHQIIIKCLVYLPKDIHYLIIGRGSEQDNLIHLCEKLEVSDRVHFLGFKNNVFEVIKSCNVFMFPSLQEGLPVALMEAIACGKICIVSAIRGNIDLIKHTINGYLVKSNDEFEYISKLRTINEINLDALVTYNNKILSKISIDNIKLDMKQIYNEMGLSKFGEDI